MLRRTLLLLAALVAAIAFAGPAAVAKSSAPAPVPAGVVGMNLTDPFFNTGIDEAQQFGVMVGAGIESVRAVFSWAAAQPQQNGPIDFTATDQLVAMAAARGMTVMPTVMYSPAWAAAPIPSSVEFYDLHPPGNDAAYAAYVKALVQRYGPHGSFWKDNPTIRKVPIRLWQIWNEPNFNYDWPEPKGKTFAASYVKLVKATRAAIKSVDPGAKVVLAGFPNYAWEYVADVYKVPGARSSFDIVAVHPYTTDPKNVIKFLQKVRTVMNANGDKSKPMVITETGWQSSQGQDPSDDYCCQTTGKGQASKIAALLPLLGANRKALNLIGFYFYTWVGQQFRGAGSFNFAGLFNLVDNTRFVAKPAYATFRNGALTLESCRAKGSIATVCRKPR
jgi:hypothetical protein